jgi:hypothetical protein
MMQNTENKRRTVAREEYKMNSLFFGCGNYKAGALFLTRRSLETAPSRVLFVKILF